LNDLILHPIGTIRTPFADRYRAPRQPGEAEVPAEGVIELLPDQNFEQALADLDGFERIWVIYWFHRNATWKPKVLPPRGSRVKRGLFATRSPHRPNPLGLSLLTLLEVRGRTLHVGNVDLLDGTPILDIKPYLPFVEAFPDSRIGWLEEVLAAEQMGESGGFFSVHWSDLANEQASWLRSHHEIELAEHAERVLRRDPFPHPYRRISQRDDGGFELAIKSWRLRFRVEGKAVTIERIESGYSRDVLGEAHARSLHDQAAHEGFQRRWGSV
jgi:tRNA-Thr(GGU) m(6)t(6)A37 methyltransferase TsaA